MILSKVQELCKKNHTNISKLERELNFGNGSIRKWGKSYPGTDKAEMIADHFGISVDDLLGRDSIKLSDEGKYFAEKYDSLSKEKQNLIKCYISVLQSN